MALPATQQVRQTPVTTEDRVVQDILRDAPPLMTYEKVAQVTGISARTWRRWTRQGLVLVVRPAGHGHPRLPRAAVADALKSWLSRR